MSLSLILATRLRPGFLVATIKTTLENIKLPDTKLVIAMDDDDSGSHSMMHIPELRDDPRVIFSNKPREDSLGAKYNRVLTEAPADIYGVMVDYAPCITPGFDEKIHEAAAVYPDGYVVILNHLANLSFSQFNGVTAKMAKALGNRIYDETYPVWFIDHDLEDIAKQIGRGVFCDIQMDCSKRPGTMEKKEPAMWAQIFNALHGERAALAEKIIKSPDFNETPFRKRALLRNRAIVTEWSQIINQMVIRDADQGVQPQPDDVRYWRHREKILNMLVEKGLAKREEPAEEQKAA